MYSSDVRPTTTQMYKPHIGVLEMGILGATGLMPMKIKEGKGGSTDTYCVAKYGVKEMGELHLALRFTCANMVNVLHMYTLPLLPKMHYVWPLSGNQLESLRVSGDECGAALLSRAEAPLRREVVEYMLDHDSHMWSMRCSKANFFHLVSVLSSVIALGKWLESVRSWQKPVYSILFLMFFFVLDVFPELILPCILLCLSCSGFSDERRWRLQR
ncbi:hypothetical protein NE237_030489 [Protea cynaroides]|uniref:Uncharacterized protein n=1 Tax=Protea cynaroides TaxID=273540 RepID=A0A9Q0JW42_9MAGN|nr:hypothetical protein NE237_030489 [Protea cynaroides]